MKNIAIGNKKTMNSLWEMSDLKEKKEIKYYTAPKDEEILKNE